MNRRPQLAQDVQGLHQQVAQLQRQVLELEQQVAQLQQQNEQIVQNQGDVNEHLARIDGRLQNAEDFLPIKLYNSSISPDCPLLYPRAVAVERPMPNTKAEILDLTVAQCITVARRLGLAHLEAGTTVNGRRKQISDYLGCGIVL